MKTLLLMRHAKSDWDHPQLDDHDRPLNSRGLRNAPLLGQFMLAGSLVPDLCLTSTAVRARHTAWLAVAAMKTDVPIVEVPGLYDFGSGGAFEDAISQRGGNAQTLLVVGHNPSIQAFALATCGGGDDEALGRLKSKYPTCGLCEITYDMPQWAGITTVKGVLKAFTTPRSLQ